MSFFKKKDKNPLGSAEKADALILIERYESGEIETNAFLLAISRLELYYSTPFGEHKDGGGRLFALPETDATAFLPIFTSVERLTEFYEGAGRQGYIIINGDLKSFLSTISKVNAGETPVKLGAVIDPMHSGITIASEFVNKAIEIMG